MHLRMIVRVQVKLLEFRQFIGLMTTKALQKANENQTEVTLVLPPPPSSFRWRVWVLRRYQLNVKEVTAEVVVGQSDGFSIDDAGIV